MVQVERQTAGGKKMNDDQNDDQVDDLESDDSTNDGGDANSDDSQSLDDTASNDANADAKSDSEPTAQEFVLPDGRTVNKDTFEFLWKEHFYPDYTKKSQELSQLRDKIRELEEGKSQSQDDSKLSDEEKRTKAVIDEITKKAEEGAYNRARNELLPLVEELKLKDEEKKVENEIADLSTKYGEKFNAEETIKYAMQYKILDLSQAFKLMKFDELMQSSAETAKNNTVNDMKRKHAASMTPNSSNKPATGLKKFDPKADSDKSISDLINEGLAELANK